MKKSKKIINSLLLTLSCACLAGGSFLTLGQFDNTSHIAFAETGNYDEISNSLPNYFNINTDNSSNTFGNVDNKIFLISNTEQDKIEIKIAENEKEAKSRKFKVIYLKTELVNYYEKFGAILIKKLKSGEYLYKFDL